MTWPREHRLRHSNLNLDELGRRLSAQLGFGVAVISRLPADGVDGVLRFERVGVVTDTDVEEILIDPRTVVSTIDTIVADQARDRAHASRAAERQAALTDPSRWQQSVQTCLDTAAAAATTEDKLAAVLDWLQRELAVAQALHQH